MKFLFFVVFSLLCFQISHANSVSDEELSLLVGQKRSFSEKKYVFFRSGNNRVVSVKRDPLSRNIKIEATKVGQTFFIFHEVGAASPRRVLVNVKPKKIKAAGRGTQSTRLHHCKRGRFIRFGTECRFFLPGWDNL